MGPIFCFGDYNFHHLFCSCVDLFFHVVHSLEKCQEKATEGQMISQREAEHLVHKISITACMPAGRKAKIERRRERERK